MGRSFDGDDLDLYLALPRYGGGPSPLRDPVTLARAKALLLVPMRGKDVAVEIGYAKASAFSEAFRRVTGMPPGAFQRAHGVTPPRGHGGYRQLGRRRPPDRSGEEPLPRYRTDPTPRRGERIKELGYPADLTPDVL